MNYLVIIAGLAAVAFLIVLWLQKTYSIWRDMGAPYEEPSYFYGNLKGVGSEEHAGSRLQKLYHKYKDQKCPFVGIYFFLKPAALLIDLELVKNVMIRDFSNFHDRGVFYNEKDEPIGANLFSLHGPKWKLLRSKLSPTFTSGKMKLMFPTIVDVAKRFEAKIDTVSRLGEELDMKQLMGRFTVDVIGTCAFGLNCNSLEDEDSEFHRVGMGIFGNPRHSLSQEWLLLTFRKYAQKLGIKRFRNEVSDFYTKVVRSTVDYRIANKIEHKDFMDLLIKLYQAETDDRITFNELLGQAFVFFLAGFETSSTTLQFCFYELAANPDIQTKAREHINEVLARYDGELTYEAMLDMKYIDQIINETLRLYPPLMTLLRETDKDYQVPGTKFVFKKGTSMVIPAFAIHRDPDIYPNPLKFDPEHFSDENIRDRPSVTFLPFGDGPRVCIGARFGLMQTRIGIITALRKYKYSLSPRTEHPIRFSNKAIVSAAVGGIWLKIDPL